MTVALARRLVWEGVLAPEEVSTALQAHVIERLAFVRALVRGDPTLLPRLEAELGHLRGGSAPAIEPDAELMRALPPALPLMLLAVPVGKDPTTGVVRIVAADPSDAHVAIEMSHHLGAAVEVVSGPLRALFEALGVRSSSSPPRAQLDVAPLKHAPAAVTTMRPSDRPIPLLRVSSDAPGPRTVKGVAPQASGAAFASSVVVPPRVAQRTNSEPVIQLTRTKSLGPPSSPSGAPVSSGPSTVHGSPSPTSPPGAPAPSPPGAPAPSPPGAASRARGPDTSIADFQSAGTPEDVVSILVRGLSRVARLVVVLAVRGKVFEGRDTNDEAARDAVRALVISGDRPSVALTAMQTGQYVGPMPQTLVHQELSRILGGPNDDIAVSSVTVSGRAALVYVASGLDTTYLATRRGEALAQAASRALERIVRGRKK
jgi:hypothetical protein